MFNDDILQKGKNYSHKKFLDSSTKILGPMLISNYRNNKISYIIYDFLQSTVDYLWNHRCWGLVLGQEFGAGNKKHFADIIIAML